MFSQEDFLAHYGVLGMHWGVRRYQNDDGTLTVEGRQRYSKNKSTKRNPHSKNADNANNTKNNKEKIRKILIVAGVVSVAAVSAYIIARHRHYPHTVGQMGLPDGWPSKALPEGVSNNEQSVKSSVKKTIDKLTQHFKKNVEPSLTEKEKSSLSKYSSGDYQDINWYLEKDQSGVSPYQLKAQNLERAKSMSRPGREDYIKEQIQLIDSAFDKAPRTTDDMIVNRKTHFSQIKGMLDKRMSAKEIENALHHPEKIVGETMTLKGYGSTSIDPTANSQFGQCNLHILVPKGSKGMYIAPISKNPRETEFLLPRNSRFRLIEVKNFSPNPETSYFSAMELFLELIS